MNPNNIAGTANRAGAAQRKLRNIERPSGRTRPGELENHGSGAVIPYLETAEQWNCPHGNHFCVACDNCGRHDPRNLQA